MNTRSALIDVAVVGAGPAGLIAASEASKRGVSVQVFEEHPEIGVPSHCAGLVSANGLESLGISRQIAESEFVLNKIRGARFHSPKGQSVVVETEDIKAYAIDRVAFDRFLSEKAEREGAEVILGQKVESVSIGRDSVSLSILGGEKAEARIVIDGEGVASRLLGPLGLDGVEKRPSILAAQYEVVSTIADPEQVDIFVGRNVAPRFFAWFIPLSSTRGRLGLGVDSADAAEFLEKLHKSRFEECRILSRAYGRIPIRGPIERISADRVLVVGDAAGHVKPTTGGGIILGGLCARIAGLKAAEAVKLDDLSAADLRGYDRECERRYGSEFSKMLLARRVLSRLEDDTIERLFEIAQETDLVEKAEAMGDMDLQSKIIDVTLRNPAVWRALLPVARNVFFS